MNVKIYICIIAITVGLSIIGCQCDKTDLEVFSGIADEIIISVGTRDLAQNDRPYVTNYYQIDRKYFDDFFKVFEQTTQASDEVLGPAQILGYDVTVYISSNDREEFRRIPILTQWVEGMGGKNNFDTSKLNDGNSRRVFKQFYLDKGNVMPSDKKIEFLKEMETSKASDEDSRYWKHEK